MDPNQLCSSSGFSFFKKECIELKVMSILLFKIADAAFLLRHAVCQSTSLPVYRMKLPNCLKTKALGKKL